MRSPYHCPLIVLPVGKSSVNSTLLTLQETTNITFPADFYVLILTDVESRVYAGYLEFEIIIVNSSLIYCHSGCKTVFSWHDLSNRWQKKMACVSFCLHVSRSGKQRDPFRLLSFSCNIFCTILLISFTKPTISTIIILHRHVTVICRPSLTSHPASKNTDPSTRGKAFQTALTVIYVLGSTTGHFKSHVTNSCADKYYFPWITN